MSNDLVARARKALGDVQPPAHRSLGGEGGASAPFDPAKGAKLLARAQATIEAPPKQTMISTPPPAPPPPRAERVKVPVTCSARGVSYVVIAERRDDELRFVGHEMPQAGPGGAPRLPGRLEGRYRIDAASWVCPLCANAGGVWLCDCERMNGAMHCLGSAGGRYRCACGRAEEREFVNVQTVEVRGASVAATPGGARSGPQQPQLKQVSHG